MQSRTISKSDRKAKKSFTISTESVAFLETVRKKRRAASVSAILEEILQTVRRNNERASVERSVADYYGSLSAGELADQAQWGEFATGEFPKEDRS
jgi:hypothetical protein